MANTVTGPESTNSLSLLKQVLGSEDLLPRSKEPNSNASRSRSRSERQAVLLNICSATASEHTNERHKYHRTFAFSTLDISASSDVPSSQEKSWTDRISTNFVTAEHDTCAENPSGETMASNMSGIVQDACANAYLKLVEKIQQTPNITYIMVHDKRDNKETATLKYHIVRTVTSKHNVRLLNASDIFSAVCRDVVAHTKPEDMDTILGSIIPEDHASKSVCYKSANVLEHLVRLDLTSNEVSKVALSTTLQPSSASTIDRSDSSILPQAKDNIYRSRSTQAKDARIPEAAAKFNVESASTELCRVDSSQDTYEYVSRSDSPPAREVTRFFLGFLCKERSSSETENKEHVHFNEEVLADVSELLNAAYRRAGV